MVFPAEESESEALLPRENRSTDLKALSSSVFFSGWRFASKKFKSWATKMSHLHEPTWRKAGIFKAVMASTYTIHKNTDLVLGLAEKWCHDTKTFVFSWGETTITLEDVMVLLGFSVLGSPVFATLDASGEKIKAKLEKEWLEIRDNKVNFVTQVAWMNRFMDSGDELEHVAFLVLWLSYFVFPSRFYHLSNGIFPIAVLLSSGTRMALAPAVLAHLYAELTLLKTHIRDFDESTSSILKLPALFKLVQVWTWERFKDIQPKPNPMLKNEPRLACWSGLEQRTTDARRILGNSKIDNFEWRPYTKSVKNWEFTQFYPEKPMWVPVGPDLDDEFISFARCIKVSELVGIGCVEHYFPDRVISQFGMLQDVPASVNHINLSQEAAWNDYNKPIDDMILYIPSRSVVPRVTPTFCEWWRKSFAELQRSLEKNRTSHDQMAGDSINKRRAREKRRMYMNRVRDKRRKYVKQAKTLKSRTIIGDGTSFVHLGFKMNRLRKDRMTIAEDLTNKRRKFKKLSHEKDVSKLVTRGDDDEDMSLTIAEIRRLDNKKTGDVKNRGEITSEALYQKCRLEADDNELRPCGSIGADRDETLPPISIEQMNEETDETRSTTAKGMVLSPYDETNCSDPPVGFGGASNDIVESAPETRQTCDDELDVYGRNVEKITSIDDGRKETNCFPCEDCAIASEKANSDEKFGGETKKEDDVVDDDILIQKKLAIEADNNEPSPRQNGDEISKAGNGTQGKDCLLHDNCVRSEGTIKSSEQVENVGEKNNDVSNEKRMHDLKVLASSIEEDIRKLQKNVAWLKERRAIKKRKTTATTHLI